MDLMYLARRTVIDCYRRVTASAEELFTQMHADAVFLRERLAPALDAIVISKRARYMMLQILWLAVINNTSANRLTRIWEPCIYNACGFYFL